MAKRPYPRIEISQHTFELLQLESIRLHKSIKDILDDLVDKHICPEVVKASLVLSQSVEKPMSHRTKEPIKLVEQIEPIKPIEPVKPIKMLEPSGQIQTKTLLQDNLEAQAEILRLYNKGMAVRQICKQVGYAESTVRDFVNRKIRAGEWKRR
jgi:DNA-binding NarL/FixJ family response regulator